MGEIAHTVVRPRDSAASLVGYPRAPAATVDVVPVRQTTFIEDLYAAAVEFPRMAPALASFARALGADLAWLVACGDQGLGVVERAHADAWRPAAEAEFMARLGAELDACVKEVHVGALSQGPRGDVVYYLAIVPAGHGELTQGLVTLRTHAPFSDNDRETARSLIADIRRALQLRGRASRAEAFSLAQQMFENNPIAMLVARGRTVERSNAAASALLAMRRPIAVAAGKLHFDDSRPQMAFESLSRADQNSSARKAFAFVVEGVEGRTWIVQLSLAPGATHARQVLPPVVIALTPFSGASRPREAMLNGFTDLTPTERAIFAAFVDGDDVAAIAAKMDRSVETVRWHVRNLFTKLGVNSQADLARLGALLLPL